MIKLPTAIKQPKDDPGSFSLLLFGPSKVGKTSLCAQFPGHFILEFNPGNADHLTRNSVDVKSWEETIEYLDLLSKTPDYCKTLVVDEFYRLYFQLYKWARKIHNKQDTDKNNYDVWLLVRDKLFHIVEAAKTLSSGLIVTGNVEEIQGDTIAKLTMAGTEQVRKALDGRFLMRAYMSKNNEGERFLTIDGDPRCEVGHCFSELNHFLCNGKRLKKFSLGYSPSEAYKNFMSAYNNSMAGEVIEGPPKKTFIMKKK